MDRTNYLVKVQDFVMFFFFTFWEWIETTNCILIEIMFDFYDSMLPMTFLRYGHWLTVPGTS